MMVIASETTEEEKKQSNGKMSRVHNLKSYFFYMKQKLFLSICARTPGVGTACGNRRNLTFKVSIVTCIHTCYFSALVN
jgi:hypothetical protein